MYSFTGYLIYTIEYVTNKRTLNIVSLGMRIVGLQIVFKCLI